MKLTFKDTETNREIIESNVERDNSLFAVQYGIAKKTLNVLSSAEGSDIRKYNNIIAFCGDRGSGKSSCMKSFIEQQKESKASDVCFLEPIDPSFFDESHNILELVIGRLYSKVCKYEIDENNDDKKSERNQLLLLFDNVMRDLKFIAKAEDREKFYDCLQELDALSVGIDLKDKIKDLMDDGLKYLGNKLLYICIDDLDLNINGVYTMSEHIRKYLINEKCIIFIGVKIDQLIESIKISIANNSKVSIDEAYIMAVKYVAKLIPVSSRINMPELNEYRNIELDYLIGNDVSNFHSVQEAVTHQIFWKTGYLFYNSKGSCSFIIPRNLRSIRQLLHLLSTMPIHDKRNYKQLHENQKIFKKYFFDTWTQQLNDEGRQIAYRLLNDSDNQTFNKRVIYALNAIDKQNTDNTYLQQYAYNVTMGDVIAELYRLEQTTTDYQTQLILFFIRSLCSIKMYEAYDEVTENIKTELFPEPDKNKKGEIYKTDNLFNRINKIQRVINGRYFTYSGNEVLPFRGNEEKNHRDLLFIDGKKLGNELKRIGGIRTDIRNNEEEKKKFKVLEYFMLCVSRYAITKSRGVKSDDLRKIPVTSDPVFVSDFNYGTKNLVFDVLAPFFNISNLKMTYNRFNDSFQNGNAQCPSLYDFANGEEWTLLHSLNNMDIRDYDDKQHVLLSDAVIRNAEVLIAVTERVKSNRNQSYSSTDSNKILGKFYESITDTGMNTYPQKPADEPYLISFAFLGEISALLNDCDTDYFDSIYIREENDNEIYLEEIFTRDTYRSSTIINKLKEHLNDVFKTKTQKEWNEIFPNGIDISSTEIISKLNDIL